MSYRAETLARRALAGLLYRLHLRQRPPAFIRDPLTITRREKRYATERYHALARQRGWPTTRPPAAEEET